MAEFVCARCGQPFMGTSHGLRATGTMYCPTCIQEMRKKAPRNPALDAQLAREKEHKVELARTKALRKR